jgi:D-alanyl-D-alanine carboxypeptidase
MSAVLLAMSLTLSGTIDLQPLLDSILTDQDVPGISAAVTHREEVVFAGGSGLADIESGRPMTADTVLYAGSLSKILTAVLALKLVDEGKVALEQRVEGIAENGNADVRLEELLTHSSGLVREGDFGYWFSADFPDRNALGAFLRRTELLTPPGQRVRYSNIGFAALGIVIEDATKLGFHEALRRQVLEPLGMNDSGSPGPAAGIAAGYTPKGRMIPSEARPFAGVGRQVGERWRRDYHDAKAMTPAFGIYTTAADLGRLSLFLLGYNGELMSEELRQSLLTRRNGNRTYGLGTGSFRGHRVARHSGWFAAHRSHILIDLDSEVAVVVLANSDNADPGAAAKALLGAVLDSGTSADSVN